MAHLIHCGCGRTYRCDRCDVKKDGYLSVFEYLGCTRCPDYPHGVEEGVITFTTVTMPAFAENVVLNFNIGEVIEANSMKEKT